MKPDLIVVSSYPPQGQTHGIGTVGVASYTKNTLTSLPSALNILVLAEKLPNQSPEYQEKNINILRCWQRNSLKAFLDILKNINKYHQIPVMIEFEMAMFGKPILNIFFPILLLILKLKKHPTTIVLHQVVLNFNEISGHIGQSKNSPLNTVLNFLAKIFYQSVISFSSKIIVFEQFLKDRLNKNNQKIFIIPHGVEVTNTSNNIIKKNKNNLTITIFGFLAWYKGTDWIVKTFGNYFSRHPKSKLKLVVAGGPNPNHLDKAYYQKYLSELNNIASKHPQNIQITGFVDEKDIEKYYQLSDLILLPYRVGMSSSGPLSIAFTHHKPFFVSDKIAPILNTSDIKTIFEKHSLSSQIVSFPLNSKKLLEKIIHLKKDSKLQKELGLISQEISLTRSWNNVSKQYLTCLNL